MWLNGRLGEQRGQQVQQSQPQNLGGGQIPNLGNLSQVPGGSRPLGAFSATGPASAGSAPGYPPFEQSNFTPLVPGYSHGQSLARTHPSGRLHSALQPQPRHQLYRLVPVEPHDLTGLGVAGHVEPVEALYQLSQPPPVAGGLHQGFGAGQVLSFSSDMGMLPGLVMQTPQGVQSSFMPVLGGGTPQLQQALSGSAQRGQGEEQHPGMVSLVLGQMPLHLHMPGMNSVAALQPPSGVSQFPVQTQQQALFAPQGSALHTSIYTHAQHMTGQDDASFHPGSRSSSGAGHEGGASQGWSVSWQRLNMSERSHMPQSRPTTARGLSDTPQPYSGRRKPWKIALTSEQAKDIYTQRPQNAEFVGARSAALAEQYSVNPKTIRDIWHRATWVKATQPAWTRAEFIEWKKQQESAKAKSKAGKARNDLDEDEDEQEGGHISRSASPFRFEQYSAISSGLECAEQGTADLDASTSVANKANSTSAWQAVANLTARDTEAAGIPAHAPGRGEPSRDDQEGGSSSRPDQARRRPGGRGVGGGAGKDSGAAGKDEDSELGDDDMPFPLDVATLDQLMPKRGRPVGAKDTKQRKKRMGATGTSHPPRGEGSHNRGSGRTSADAGSASSAGVSGSGGDTAGGEASHPHGPHHLQPNLR